MLAMSRLMKAHMAFTDDLMHISHMQLHALIFLNQTKNASMSEIAQEFRIELPSTTSLITKLVQLGLVQRVADKKDRRLVRIQLSKKGISLLDTAMKERRRKITHLLATLTEQEQKQFLTIMSKFKTVLEEVSEK